VLSALDADVIKTYVEVGLGIGIIASVAFNPAKDSGLRLLRGDHLFERNTAWIALRKGHYLRGFVYRFLEQCDPQLTPATIKEAILSPQGLEMD
jgi:LysR family cys regulon transcriptional activator